MKMGRVVFFMAVLAGLTLASASAQAIEKGTGELGIFERVSFFDPALNLRDWGGLGLRAGYFFHENLELEADLSRTATDGQFGDLRRDVLVNPFHARVVWNRPCGEKTHLLLGGGYVHTEYGDEVDGHGDGAGALVGFRYQAGKKLSFRFEGTADYYADTDFTDKDDHVDYGVQFGFSGLFGGGPRDADKDGVIDSLDKCPGTPLGEKVDANGCPLPKDRDGDGVLDNKDQCPDTPKGDKVDASGCSLPKDSDGDGVTDDLDKCPGTAAGTKVDRNGCPQLFDETKASFVLEGVNFASGKADLTPEAREVLDRVVTSLAAYPEIRVEVAGHTDNKGSRALNTRLSQKRADAVKNYLAGAGISPERLVAKGYGPDKPIATNDTEEGRAQNRRTELKKLN